MAKHAFSSGLQVDGAIVQFLENFGERKSCSQLGGFSSSAVYRILNSLVGAVESLVRGSTEDLVKSKVREAEVRLAEQTVENRMSTASQLLRLQQSIDSAEIPDEVRQNIDSIVQNLLPLEENSRFTLNRKD